MQDKEPIYGKDELLLDSSPEQEKKVHTPKNWQATAFNTSPHSDNQIHSDEMAQTYGFRGGLVPGVVVSAYLIHPAVEAWGLDWLERGHAKVVVHNPTYDGDVFSVHLSDVSPSSYRAALLDPSDTVNASGEITLVKIAPNPPTMRGDPIVPSGFHPPQSSIETMLQLRDKGMWALDVRWDQTCEITSYLSDATAMPQLHREDQEGFANAGFMLGLTNWVLAANVSMNPWIHLQTESQFYAPVHRNTLLRVECDIQELFTRSGHEFVDLNVNTFVQQTCQPVMSAQLRAIYKMRTSN